MVTLLPWVELYLKCPTLNSVTNVLHALDERGDKKSFSGQLISIFVSSPCGVPKAIKTTVTTTGMKLLTSSHRSQDFKNAMKREIETWMAIDAENSVGSDRYGVVRITIRVLSYSTTAAQENQRSSSKNNEGVQ
ncbi:hypothetical protein TNCV_5122751 [Trichonephila clavipes]|nr:hypothetical protein TNCV_5122751 [Trichonephila clavipes]